MIPLRIKAETDSAAGPFIVRLRTHDVRPGLAASPAMEAFEGYLQWSSEHVAGFSTSNGNLRLFDIGPLEVDGDVLLVVPERNIAHRLIRARSDHNTFLVTERCDQLCLMCSQPPKRHHIDLFPYFETAALLAPAGATIGISGGEPTLYKDQLLALLDRVLTARPDLRFHVLTNAQHFGSEDLPALQALPSEKVLWGIPLYSPDPGNHDVIVSKVGAHQRLLESLALLCRAGAAIELRTVVMAKNAKCLPRLARFIARHLPFVQIWALMQLENFGYARKNWGDLFFDNSLDFSPIAAAVDVARAQGVPTLLYNFPLCTVPEPYRAFAPATISDWKRRYLDICDGCGLRSRCGGFFEWYPDERGFERLGRDNEKETVRGPVAASGWDHAS